MLTLVLFAVKGKWTLGRKMTGLGASGVSLLKREMVAGDDRGVVKGGLTASAEGGGLSNGAVKALKITNNLLSSQ